MVINDIFFVFGWTIPFSQTHTHTVQLPQISVYAVMSFVCMCLWAVLLVSMTSDLNFTVIVSNALDCVVSLCKSDYHSLSKCSEVLSEGNSSLLANCVTQLILDISVLYWSIFQQVIEKNRQNFPTDIWLFPGFYICYESLIQGFCLNLLWAGYSIPWALLPILGA